MTPAVLDKLRGLVGREHVLTGVDCSPYVVDGRTPDAVVFPGTREEVAAVVTQAAEDGVPVTPWGGGTRMSIGAPPVRLGIVLGLRRLARVIEHEPGDLTVTVEAGIGLGALQAELQRRGQWLSLDPADPGASTIGGVIAANASGPRRHLYGTARDLLIGLGVVTGDGALVRGGGKVVKNVAGYDLPKLFVGSFGTLGVLVEVTLKLRPRPDEDRVVIARLDGVKACGEAVRAVMASDLVPSALEVVDGEAMAALGLGPGAAVWVGLDGIREQVDWQCAEVKRRLGPLGLRECRVLDGAERDRAWRSLGALPRQGLPEVAGVMTWSVLPAQAAEVMEQGAAVAARHGLRSAFTAHAGVGLVTAALSGSGGEPASVTAALEQWRRLVRAAGGHAQLEWAPLAVKEQVAVWDDPGPDFRLMKAIKDRLDPHGILSPGRFVGGI